MGGAATQQSLCGLADATENPLSQDGDLSPSPREGSLLVVEKGLAGQTAKAKVHMEFWGSREVDFVRGQNRTLSEGKITFAPL